ncbi:antA/AntB antirepressor family protein [Bartonella sp. AU15XJBT]|uniref:antA/AntB antirepressor family protein n=1 Tax=Bartonella sp. AU15XJBT TaxID=3019087 RepID=UPI00235E6EB4|nr:antA/AntB antirepressor family protein [Bartonella sp. AU15XJBT]
MTTHDNDSEGYLIPENEVGNKIGYAKMVKAHVMHRHLHLKQDFSTWFNDCVEKFDLKEGVDFVFTKQEWNRQKICPKSEIETYKTDNHYFKIHAARKIAKAERHRNYGIILYQNLCFS